MSVYGEEVKDRAKELTTAEGAGDMALDSVASGYVSLPTGTFYYCVTSLEADEWEVGVGHLATYPSRRLVRDSVLSNSSGGTSNINFSAGSKEVFSTIPAQVLTEIMDACAAVKPASATATYTSDDTPVDVTIGFIPAPNDSGGFALLVVSFIVFANNGSMASIAWDCRMVYREGFPTVLTKTVIHTDGTLSADVSADVVSDEVVVTLTGDPSKTIYWSINAVVDGSTENGV